VTLTVTGRVRRAAAALGVAAVVGAVALPPGGLPANAATETPAFTKTVDAVRKHVEIAPDGTRTDKTIDDYHVTISVDRTTELQDQQDVQVTWKGAPKSSNIVFDPNTDNSADMQHPMVILQCRGTATSVSPETCWAPLGFERQNIAREAAPASSEDVGNFPAWRLDRYAAPADRAQFVGLPNPIPTSCKQGDTIAMRIVPFIAADGTRYYASGNHTECGKRPPEAPFAGDLTNASTAFPDNAAFVPTDSDGTGSYRFNVRDATTNASLGCSATISCALVVIPIVGISCDPGLDDDDPGQSPTDDPYYVAGRPDRAVAACEENARVSGSVADFARAVSGQYWWSSSNWRNRVVVPLGFQKVSAGCTDAQASSDAAFYGSELIYRAALQWGFRLCETGAPTFDHVATTEILGRSLVGSGAVDAAFGSRAPDFLFQKPIAQAPVAATGFAISFVLDDQNKKQVTKLRLTPRLLAKLITESYPTSPTIANSYGIPVNYGNTTRSDYPLKDNPNNLVADPEFKALNPGVAEGIGRGDTLVMPSTPSDIVYALTAYINADPEARAWLDGQPDPWGMVVNPNYRGIPLPTYSWPLLDTWDAPGMTEQNSPYGPCGRGTVSRPPYLSSLIAAPVQRLAAIGLAIRFAIPYEQWCSSVSNVDGEIVDYRISRIPRQIPGVRIMLGLTSLGDADFYGLETAELETSSTAPVPPGAFTTRRRTFAGPTGASLRAAFGTLQRNSQTNIWDLSAKKLRSVPSAYPGAMLVYADIPTTGLSAADAKTYSSILKYMIGAGQVSGDAVGELPGGFLPLTATNGLGVLAACTNEAVTHIAAQDGKLPCRPTAPPSSTHTTPSPGSTSPSPSTSTSSASGPPTSATPSPTTSSAASAGTDGPSTSTGNTPTPTRSGSAAPISPGVTSAPPQQAVNKISGPSTSSFRILGILAVILLLVGPLTAPGVLLMRRRQSP